MKLIETSKMENKYSKNKNSQNNNPHNLKKKIISKEKGNKVKLKSKKMDKLTNNDFYLSLKYIYAVL